MSEELDFGLSAPVPPKGAEKKEKPDTGTGDIAFSDEQVAKLIKQAEEDTKVATSSLVCAVFGTDGSGKTGIVQDHCAKQEKKTLIIDLDGGNLPIWKTYHKDNTNLIVFDPYEYTADKSDIIPDYQKMIAKIKAVLMYVKNHHEEYSCVVLDGISTLLKFCEYLMRLDKQIAPDGGVNLRYWLQRNKRFTEVLDYMKSIPNVDKFFIGHEDFIMKDEAAAVKAKTNQMIHQRIICKKTVDKATKDVTFTATVDKCKFNLALEGREHVFATVKKSGDSTWDTSKIFEGLK